MEEQLDLKIPKTVRQYGQVQTSVLISSDYWELCKKHNIKFSEAVRVGISMMLADRGVRDYDNDLNLFRKLQLVRKQLEATSKELYELKDKVEKNHAQNEIRLS